MLFLSLLLMAAMPRFCSSNLIPLKIGNFYKDMSENNLGGGFKINVVKGEDPFKKRVVKGKVETKPFTTNKSVSEIITDDKSLKNSMEIEGQLAVSYGPLISGEGYGSYVKKAVSSTRHVTVAYRSRHSAFYKRLQPGTITTTKGSRKFEKNPHKLADKYGTRFIDSIIYGAQLDVMFTITATEDIDIEEIKAELAGKIGVGPLSVKFKAKFEKREGEERARYNMKIHAEALGVLVTIPANPSFEDVSTIIDNFNKEYTEKFANFKIEGNPLLKQIEPVGFNLASTADKIETLDDWEVMLLEDRMADLEKAFRHTLLWKAKLDVINEDLDKRYEKDFKLRREMYDIYFLKRKAVINSIEGKIDEYLEFRAKPLAELVGPNVRVPDTYPEPASEDEKLCRGLSGEYYMESPVQLGENEPIKNMYYIGFALKDENTMTMIPWMYGSLLRRENGDVKLIASAETPDELYEKVAPSLNCKKAPDTVKPGYSDSYRGWYDISGCGLCNDYCRWVGNSGAGGNPAIRTTYFTSYWSCKMAGSNKEYTPPKFFWTAGFTQTKCNHKGAIAEAKKANEERTVYILASDEDLTMKPDNSRNIKLHKGRTYAMKHITTEYRLVHIESNKYIICSSNSDYCMHSYGGSKEMSSIRFHGNEHYARQKPNSQYILIRSVGEPSTYHICASDADLCMHAYGGNKEGKDIVLHGNLQYAKKHPNSKFTILELQTMGNY